MVQALTTVLATNPAQRVVDAGLLVTAQAHHLAGDQQIHDLADDVDREEKRREPDIEERRGQERHRQEGALRCQVSAHSIRVVTQILQQPFVPDIGFVRDMPIGQVRHVPLSCCAFIAVSGPVSQHVSRTEFGFCRARRHAITQTCSFVMSTGIPARRAMDPVGTALSKREHACRTGLPSLVGIPFRAI
jgi:hypothetical protein